MMRAALALALTPWYRLLSDYSILYPPSHYLARQAAGLLLAMVAGITAAVLTEHALDRQEKSA